MNYFASLLRLSDTVSMTDTFQRECLPNQVIVTCDIVIRERGRVKRLPGN